MFWGSLAKVLIASPRLSLNCSPLSSLSIAALSSSLGSPHDCSTVSATPSLMFWQYNIQRPEREEKYIPYSCLFLNIREIFPEALQQTFPHLPLSIITCFSLNEPLARECESPLLGWTNQNSSSGASKGSASFTSSLPLNTWTKLEFY